jgi:uncharacterized membrane protein YeiH
MLAPNEPLSASILAIMYFGDVVFAVSGALTAGKNRMDMIGFILVGTITGIGGGTTRDLLLGRTVWWTQNPEELLLCVAASLVTFFFVKDSAARNKWMNWSDALGLASFAVVGCHIALGFGASFVIAVFMGMLTATGGGVIRDIITNRRPMIMRGQLYATAALGGALVYGSLVQFLSVPELAAELAGFLAAFMLRASAIMFDIRMGPPGEFIRIGTTDEVIANNKREISE